VKVKPHDKTKLSQIMGNILVWGVATAPFTSLAYCSLYNSNLQSNMEKIKAGQTKKEVIDRLGSPSWDDACFYNEHNRYGADDPELKGKCTRELGYRPAFGGLPEGSYYLVWFDADDRVITTGEIHSP
jgi:hypothetical protein